MIVLGLKLMFMGMFMVIVFLLVLICAITVARYCIERLPGPVNKPEQRTLAASSAAVLEAERLAVITAAVQAYRREQHKV